MNRDDRLEKDLASDGELQLPLDCLDYFLALALNASSSSAEVRLASIFGDHMVLQQQSVLPIWGTASPGESITVSVTDHEAKTSADDQGKWMVRLAPLVPNARSSGTARKRDESHYSAGCLGGRCLAGVGPVEHGVSPAESPSRRDHVPHPTLVRYAWAGFPKPAANLYNKEGLPAAPFTTEVGIVKAQSGQATIEPQ